MTLLPRIMLTLLACTALSSCANYGDIASVLRAPTPMAESWQSADGLSGAYQSVPWVATFNDTMLKALVSDALRHNYDLQRAASDLDRAAAQAKKSGADLLPVMNLNAQGGRSGNVETTDAENGQYGASLDVRWEIDVWGRIRAGKNAAIYDYYAAENDYAAARQSLAAQTAKAYFLAVETAQQYALTQVFESNIEKTLDVTEAFFQEGLVSMQDIHLVKVDLARAKESMQNAKSAELKALRSLEILLGRYPAASIEASGDYPAMPAALSAGLPSEMLERRPDIRAAERRVAAAFDRVEEAKAAKLPSLSLTASLGGSSEHLNTLSDPSNILWNAVGNLLFPIFNAGQLDAEIDIKTAEQKAAIANYQQKALESFSEVEAALSNEALYRARQKNLQDAYDNARAAEAIADEQFKAGEIALLDLLQIKRSTITAQIDKIRAARELLDQRVNLHLSLGGDVLDAQ
jgi:NodT family efflux transporter outer membrane factor (OMF) lipoprotein